MDKKELYGLIDEYWAEYKDKTENKPENKLKDGKYISDYVVGSMPIVWFGDYEAYNKSDLRVVTVGLNPSDKEFQKNRFPDAVDLSDVCNDEDKINLIKAYNSYFKIDPYTDWFDGGYENVLKLFPDYCSVSYGYKEGTQEYRHTKNVALHIDFYSALATDPTWSQLPKDVRKRLVGEEEGALYKKLLKKLNPHVIVFYKNNDWVSLILDEDKYEYEEYNFNAKEAGPQKAFSCIKTNVLYFWGYMNMKPWNWLNYKDDDNREKFKNIIDNYRGD